MPSEPTSQEAFDRDLASLRPPLHRYCAPMVGSGIDGEDVVQEALLKKPSRLYRATTVNNVEAWLLRSLITWRSVTSAEIAGGRDSLATRMWP